MSRDVTPTQTRSVDPYQQDVYQYDSSESKIYVSRVVNSLLNALGNNILLDGFDISNVAFADTEISCTVGAGYAIVDQTLIQTTEGSDLTYPDANLLGAGKFILHVNYKYLELLASPTELDIKISHVSSDGLIVTPDSWTADDRIVIGIFNFERDGGVITSFAKSTDYSIDIMGTTYYVGGYDSSNIHLSRFLSSIPDLTLYPNVLREGDGQVVYNTDYTQITSIIHTLPNGEFQLDYTYDDVSGNITIEKAYFRSQLLYTKTFTYNIAGLLTSWAEV